MISMHRAVNIAGTLDHTLFPQGVAWHACTRSDRTRDIVVAHVRVSQDRNVESKISVPSLGQLILIIGRVSFLYVAERILERTLESVGQIVGMKTSSGELPSLRRIPWQIDHCFDILRPDNIDPASIMRTIETL